MDLIQGLRFSDKTKAAFVGAGGKTTAVFLAARQYQSRVLVTTTTHLAVHQTRLADQHWIIEKANDLPTDPEQLQGDIILFTGPVVEDGRVSALDDLALIQLSNLADEWKCPLLIEADGARQLPLKAPADHEPAIPAFIDSVIVLVGLSGLGKPLTEEWVHRPEIFSRLAGIPKGTTINSQALFQVVMDPAGGLKNIPGNARKCLLINQIDTYPGWRNLQAQIPDLLEIFHSISFCMLEEELVLAVWERIAGVVLAAGGSTRFGKPKQLLEWGGESFIRAVSQTALGAKLKPVIVVTGSENSLVQKELRDMPVIIIDNPDWQSGQGGSVRMGVSQIGRDIGGILFLLVDQPHIPQELIHQICEAHAKTLSPIIAVEVAGQQTNPVLFDRTLFSELADLSGDQGGRALFHAHKIHFVSWDDPIVQMDVDTPEDYQRLIDKIGKDEEGSNQMG